MYVYVEGKIEIRMEKKETYTSHHYWKNVSAFSSEKRTIPWHNIETIPQASFKDFKYWIRHLTFFLTSPYFLNANI